MPDLFDTIKDRRSIRKYKPQPIPIDLILEILSQAAWAPSAHNAQPWRFIVLSEPSSKQDFAKVMAESWAEDLTKDGQKIDNEMFQARVERFATAPVLILVCLTMEDMVLQLDQRRQNVERDLAIQSLGAAIQNLLLTAHTKGLGACWFCAPGFCKETVKKYLRIPQEVEPQALIAMGYPAEKPEVPLRKGFDEVCFADKWGGMF
jgi:coenzyme F420-0:L-glutamate ligase / coenzyme F420-1:gamma-L-glutamate ligase